MPAVGLETKARTHVLNDSMCHTLGNADTLTHGLVALDTQSSETPVSRSTFNTSSANTHNVEACTPDLAWCAWCYM